MEFVFSEREDAGTFDNKGGLDYRIPVFGGIVQEPPMNIVHIAVEMGPTVKVKDIHYQRGYSWGGTEVKVWFGKVEGLSVYFVEPENGFFWTGCVYGCRKDAERFGFFCHAALEFLHQGGFHPVSDASNSLGLLCANN
ncbi:starch synthase 3, chloroplastic/amyloplastic-like [Durio zibethinus]|uniref:starch synthase n=1 Tax=Durio zibethinus TaxID=66656 RepID=A0A6P5Z7J1_DURZI|nr:starch synthase 3, chloroplastic/amyloplastic-like [Durio zibethinus]